jgi:benzoate/toluate 1,2-dioxygenase beta subunit
VEIRMTAVSAVTTSALDRATAEDLLYREARLLDDRRFTEWLDLMAEDVLYWVPSRHGDTEVVADPTRDVSLLYLNRAGLEDYVGRMSSGDAHVMEPGPRIDRLVSNVIVEDDEVVRCKWLMHAYRRGTQELFVADITYRLRPTEHGLRIAEKRILLTNDALERGFLPLV